MDEFHPFLGGWTPSGFQWTSPYLIIYFIYTFGQWTLCFWFWLVLNMGNAEKLSPPFLFEMAILFKLPVVGLGKNFGYHGILQWVLIWSDMATSIVVKKNNICWFPEIGLPPVIIHFSGIFPYKPSNIGYPIYGKPLEWRHQFSQSPSQKIWSCKDALGEIFWRWGWRWLR